MSILKPPVLNPTAKYRANKIFPEIIIQPSKNETTLTPIYALSLPGTTGSNVKVLAAASINDLTTTTWFIRLSSAASPVYFMSKDWVKAMEQNIANVLSVDHFFDGGANGLWRTAAGTVPKNQIITLAFSYDNTATTNDPVLYINGISVAIAGETTPIGNARLDNASPIIIGASVSGSSPFSGLIYEAAVFNAILTPTNIFNLHTKSIISSSFASCVMYIDFTTGKLTDLSGNSNNGTLQGNAKFIITGYK